MTKAIYFDMDGTIADLYAVEGWLEMLEAHDPTPYAQAEPMVRMGSLARLIRALQNRGYHVGVVSWLSKSGTPDYNGQVIRAKKAWLTAQMNVTFDELVFVPYGTPKSMVVEYPDGILYDDEERNRVEWVGDAYNPEGLLELLRALL